MILHASQSTLRQESSGKQHIAPEDPAWNWYLGTRQPQGWWKHRRPWPTSLLFSLDGEQGLLFGQDGNDLDASLLRLAFNAARNDWKVFFFDAQGTPENAARFLATMAKAQRDHTYVFPQQHFNGWQGNKMQIFHRLLQALPQAHNPYYRHIAMVTLGSALDTYAFAPLCMENLAETLIGQTLSRWTRRNTMPVPVSALFNQAGSSELFGDSLRYAALTMLSGNLLNGGWSYDDADAAYLSFPTWSRPEQAHLLARFLLADLTSYLAERKRDQKPVLLLMKHPTLLFGTNQLASLSTLLAAHNSSLFMAEHAPANFGQNARRVLSTASTVILHRSTNTLPFESLLDSSRSLRFFERQLPNLAADQSFLLHRGTSTLAHIAPVHTEQSALQPLPFSWAEQDSFWLFPQRWRPTEVRSSEEDKGPGHSQRVTQQAKEAHQAKEQPRQKRNHRRSRHMKHTTRQGLSTQ